jgi:GNAT superfamily N-acetyltransferase
MGVEVLPATEGDYEECARLFQELRVPDPVWPREHFVAMVVPDAFVVHGGGATLGYAWGRPRGEQFHVVHVVVDAAHRGRGIGGMLMRALASRAKGLGLARWMLNVKPDNMPARALYERWGMRVVMESASVQLAWADVPRLPAAPGAVAAPILAADDAAFERACGLSAGEISPLRDVQHRLVFGVSDATGPVAFGAYDAHFPGVAPLRVHAPHFARAILEAILPQVPTGQLTFRAFAEGDPLLEAALVAAGGTVVLRTLRMQGPIH